MAFVHDLWDYLRAIGSKWIFLMTGSAVSLGVGIWEHFRQTIPRGTFAFVLSATLFFAGFLAWRKERALARAAPSPKLEIRVVGFRYENICPGDYSEPENKFFNYPVVEVKLCPSVPPIQVADITMEFKQANEEKIHTSLARKRPVRFLVERVDSLEVAFRHDRLLTDGQVRIVAKAAGEEWRSEWFNVGKGNRT